MRRQKQSRKPTQRRLAALAALCFFCALTYAGAQDAARLAATAASAPPNSDGAGGGYIVVSSQDLVENASQWDGKKVELEGEAIGDIMPRGDHAWINLLDESTAIGIWISQTTLPPLQFTGQYFSQGDRVRVRGIMHRACPEHGGDLDIHADSAAVVKLGAITPHPVQNDRLWLCAVSIILGMICAGFWRYREKKLLADHTRD